jgi:branched-chain amino acid aminotransferase
MPAVTENDLRPDEHGSSAEDGPVWIDGALRDRATASVSAFDHGLTVGDGVFETMKIVDGQAFALSRHLRRLRRSSEGLGLELPTPDDELRSAVGATIAANGLSSGRVRVTVTGGVSPLGSDRGPNGPTVMVAVATQAPWPPTSRVVVVPWRRNEHSAVAGLKTTSYADNVVALRYARERGADEAIFANTAGDLCEGTGTNIFVVMDGRLRTPPLSSGCLAGITRELLVENVDVLEEDLPIEALAVVDEAFVTSSTRDIQPVERIDDRPLDPCPGPRTRESIDAFRQIELRTLDP